MRTKILSISIILSFLFLSTCDDYFDIEPLDVVSAEQLFTDMAGVRTVLANLYNKMPVEDFSYNPDRRFNYHDQGFNSDGGWSISAHCDEAHIVGNAMSDNLGTYFGPVRDGYWDYNGIRQVNLFFETINDISMDSETFNLLKSEGHFIRAYMYFALARRYGGVSIISEVQQIDEGGNNEALYVPRSTEKETWDYILNECDLAIENLPEIASTATGEYRATKWAAYALKSRVALHAASIAKYWNRAPLTGEAVDKKLVGGMTINDAKNYYLQCMNASKKIIDDSGKSLYKPNPINAAEAAKNFQTIFNDPAIAEMEVIFKKGYIDGSGTGKQGHCTDYYFNPSQTKLGNPDQFSRFSVSLDVVDAFEDYKDDGSGKSSFLITRTDGIEDEYSTNPGSIDVNLPFKYYNTQYDIFANKDARLAASVILPGSTWKGVTINMQGGLITTDGTPMIFSTGSAVGIDGQTYYGYGSNSDFGYSAFRGMTGLLAQANYSSTGFSLKKFLQESKTVPPNKWGSTTPFIDFRLAEIYLNYAEAVIESGQGDASLAKMYLNALRKRAGHTDEVPATIANIMKERQVELAFEGHRYWDLVRRRDMHTLFTSGKRKSLIPILDLRQNPPKYIFLRAYNHYDQAAGGVTFAPRSYYLSIPGVESNNLIQNPEY